MPCMIVVPLHRDNKTVLKIKKICKMETTIISLAVILFVGVIFSIWMTKHDNLEVM